MGCQMSDLSWKLPQFSFDELVPIFYFIMRIWATGKAKGRELKEAGSAGTCETLTGIAPRGQAVSEGQSVGFHPNPTLVLGKELVDPS